MTIDKDLVGKGYEEMAELNLQIEKEFVLAEHCACTNYEKNLKKD